MSLTKYPSALDNASNMPDRVPFVDLYEAAHINLVQDAIKAIEAELGANPSGNLATLKDRLSGVIDENGKLIPYFPGTVLTVGADHCHFTSIQAAIDSITDASSLKRYTVLVYPGVYPEDVTMKEYVDIFGYNKLNTTLQGKLTPAIHTIIANITIKKALPDDYLVDISGNYDTYFYDVRIINEDEGGAVKNTGSGMGVNFYYCHLETANEDDLAFYAYYSSKTTANFYHTTFQIGCASPVYFADGSYGQPRFENCKFLGGSSGIHWDANAGPTPTVIFSYFENWDYGFDAPSTKYVIASNIITLSPYDSIFHNVVNNAQHPIIASIYEE